MIELVLGLSLAFIMFSLGLSLTVEDFAFAVRKPRALLAGLLCQVVILPFAPLYCFLAISIFFVFLFSNTVSSKIT